MGIHPRKVVYRMSNARKAMVDAAILVRNEAGETLRTEILRAADLVGEGNLPMSDSLVKSVLAKIETAQAEFARADRTARQFSE